MLATRRRVSKHVSQAARRSLPSHILHFVVQWFHTSWNSLYLGLNQGCNEGRTVCLNIWGAGKKPTTDSFFLHYNPLFSACVIRCFASQISKPRNEKKCLLLQSLMEVIMRMKIIKSFSFISKTRLKLDCFLTWLLKCNFEESEAFP